MMDINKLRKHRELIILLIDLSIVTLSFLITTWGRFDFSIHQLILYGFQMNLYKGIGVLIVYLFCFWKFKIYKSVWKYMGVEETKNIAFAVGSATGILLLYTFIFNFKTMLINIILVSGMLTILAMFSLRAGYRMLRKSSIEKDDKQQVLIIGAGDAGYILLKELRQYNSDTLEVAGFVDDNKSGVIISGKKVLGTIDEIAEVVKQYQIQLLYFAIPSASKELKKRVFKLIEPLNIKAKMISTSVTTLKENELASRHLPIQDISIEDLLGRGEIKLEQEEITSYLTDKIILVTGAGGSIGSELCRQIIKYKTKLLLMIDINENGLYMLEQEFNHLRLLNELSPAVQFKSLIASVRDAKAIDHIIDTYHPSAVFHAAAHKHVPLMEDSPREAIKNNIFGTNNVIHACIDHKVERFIMISTDKAVNPTNVMGASKRMTELILEANRNNGVTKMAAVRFGNVLGSNGSVIPIFKEQIKQGGPVTITDKNICRYFMTIPEASQLVLQAGYYANQGETFVLDMGQPERILELAERMIRLAGYEPYKDIDIVEIGLRAGEKMFEELHSDNEEVSKTKNDLIFVNKPLDISLEEINHKLALLQKHLDDDENNLKQLLFELIRQDVRSYENY